MPKDQEVLSRLFELLDTHYIPFTKKSVMWLETLTHQKSKRAVHELRDALDHIATALHDETSKKDALQSIEAITEHFRRAAVEPAEWIALKKLEQLLDIRAGGFWWWRLLGVMPPNRKEFARKVYQGQDYIVKGRELKAVSIGDAFENFKQAYLTFVTILDDIEPPELSSRAFTFRMTIFGAILGVVLTCSVTTFLPASYQLFRRIIIQILGGNPGIALFLIFIILCSLILLVWLLFSELSRQKLIARFRNN